MEINRNKVVKIIALKRQFKQKKPFPMCPIMNPNGTGELLTGLEVLSDKKRKDFSKDELRYAEGDINIFDGQTLNLKDNYDFITFLRCTLYEQVAQPGKTRNQYHLFYLHDEEYIAIKEAEKTDKISEALEFVMNFTDIQMRDMAIFVGIDIRNVKPHIVNSHVKKHAIEHPEDILKYKYHDNKDNEMIVRKAIAYKVMRRNVKGYYIGEDFIANTLEGTVLQLFRKENEHLKSKVLRSIAAHENPTDTDSLEFLTKEHTDKKANEALAQKDLEKKILSLKFDYYKLEGSEYEGPETVEDIQAAIDIVKKQAEKIDKIEEFEAKCKEWDIKSIKKSLGIRGVEKSLFENIEDKATLIEIGINFIKESK